MAAYDRSVCLLTYVESAVHDASELGERGRIYKERRHKVLIVQRQHFKKWLVKKLRLTIWPWRSGCWVNWVLQPSATLACPNVHDSPAKVETNARPFICSWLGCVAKFFTRARRAAPSSTVWQGNTLDERSQNMRCWTLKLKQKNTNDMSREKKSLKVGPSASAAWNLMK